MNEQTQPTKRNLDGTFAKGVSGNPNGRPSRAREAALLAIGQEIVNASAWRSVVVKAVLDAQGKAIIAGQVVDDIGSTAAGRNTARTWLRDTFIGKPSEYIKLDDADSAYTQLAAYSETELAAALAGIRSEIERLRNSGGDSGTGIDATEETGGV